MCYERKRRKDCFLLMPGRYNKRQKEVYQIGCVMRESMLL